MEDPATIFDAILNPRSSTFNPLGGSFYTRPHSISGISLRFQSLVVAPMMSRGMSVIPYPG